ncbi:MAG: 6-hydroxymethylpterin diphosphokinase MptE-like protein [Planctomycetota bacterium]
MRTNASCSTFATPEPYLQSLAALWQSDPNLAKRIESADDGRALQATSHTPTSVRVGPDVLATAVEGVETALPIWRATGSTKGAAVVACWVPDLETLTDGLLLPDVAEMVADQRVRLFIGNEDPAVVADRLSGRSVHLAGGVTCIGESPEFKAFAAVVEALAERERTNVSTTIQHSRRTTMNVAGNLVRYATSPGIGFLQNAAKGRAGILVSAGPSLRRNVDRLRDARDAGFVIVAVQTAVKPLLAAGVTPHLVCSLDHSEIAARFMQDLPDDLDALLVAEPKANPVVIDTWSNGGTRPVALLGNVTAESMLRELACDRPTLPASATVAHLAFRVIEYLGCDTAVLVGQDLGFADGLAYAPGTGYDDAWRPETGRFCTFEMKQWEQIARDRRALATVTDYRGNPAYTEQRLATYLHQFEQMFAETALEVVDATEGGIAKRGATLDTLDHAIEQFRSDAGPFEVPEPESTTTIDAEDVARCLSHRLAEAERIADIADATAGPVRQTLEHPSDASIVNRAVAEIDRIRRPLANDLDLSRTFGLCATMTQQSEHDRVLADIRIEAAGGDDVQRRRQTSRRDLSHVEATALAARDLANVLRSL